MGSFSAKVTPSKRMPETGTPRLSQMVTDKGGSGFVTVGFVCAEPAAGCGGAVWLACGVPWGAFGFTLVWGRAGWLAACEFTVLGLWAAHHRALAAETSAPASKTHFSDLKENNRRARAPEAGFASWLSTGFDRLLRPDTSDSSTTYSHPCIEPWLEPSTSSTSSPQAVAPERLRVNTRDPAAKHRDFS
jgi:hypothetical protein